MKKSRLLVPLCACVLALLATTSIASVLPLKGRLPLIPGGTAYQAYYDPNLDITWWRDANNTAGGNTWDALMGWVANQTFGGATDWRLPTADVNGDGIAVNCYGGGVTGCIDNEMGFLYWEEGITPSTPGPFNVVSSGYWYSTEKGNTLALVFGFNHGGMLDDSKILPQHRAWPVHSGDVFAATVPIPPALWLFGSGLLGLIGIAKRKPV